MAEKENKKPVQVTNAENPFEGFKTEMVETSKQVEIDETPMHNFRKVKLITGVYQGLKERASGSRVGLFVKLQVDAKGTIFDVPVYMTILEFLQARKPIEGTSTLLFQYTGKTLDGKKQFNKGIK